MYHNLGIREQECTREEYQGGKTYLHIRTQKKTHLLSTMRKQACNKQRAHSPRDTQRTHRIQADHIDDEHTEGRVQGVWMYTERRFEIHPRETTIHKMLREIRAGLEQNGDDIRCGKIPGSVVEYGKGHTERAPGQTLRASESEEAQAHRDR